MTVQTFIPNGAKAASENTVTQPQHTPADGAVKKLYIETQGCQMNEYDSHRMADLLGDSHGYILTKDPSDADILLMNTCSIREKAQEKVFSELGRWRKLKEKILISSSVLADVLLLKKATIFKNVHRMSIWFLALKPCTVYRKCWISMLSKLKSRRKTKLNL